MALFCEDLSSYGAVLIPPGSQQYFDLLADIEGHLQNRPQGSPPLLPNTQSRISEHDTSGSAILVNRAKVAIATLAYFWSRLLNGRVVTSSYSPGTNPSVLLPFLQLERFRKFDAYWNTIFPGSKRLIVFEGLRIYGDNTDVRPPAPDELSAGGGFGFGGDGGNQGEPFKLTLDGVFFTDGGFAGPNQLGSWDHLVAAREAFLSASDLARSAPRTFAGRADFFARMDKLSGLDSGPQPNVPRAFAPPPPRPLPAFARADGPDRESIRKYEQQRVARTALSMRNGQDDAAAITAIAAWQDTPGPEPHRL